MGMKLLNMFNGIIYKTGTISKIDKRKDGINIFFDTSLKLSADDIGKSISCDGVCLTLISVKKKKIEFFLSKENFTVFDRNVSIGVIFYLLLKVEIGCYLVVSTVQQALAYFVVVCIVVANRDRLAIYK